MCPIFASDCLFCFLCPKPWIWSFSGQIVARNDGRPHGLAHSTERRTSSHCVLAHSCTRFPCYLGMEIYNQCKHPMNNNKDMYSMLQKFSCQSGSRLLQMVLWTYGIKCDFKHRIQSEDQCSEKCLLTSTSGKVNMISAQWLSLIGCYRDISPCHALAVITANIIIIIVIAIIAAFPITIIATILTFRRYWGEDVVGQPLRETER